jgi:hypothetical protein
MRFLRGSIVENIGQNQRNSNLTGNSALTDGNKGDGPLVSWLKGQNFGRIVVNELVGA